MDSTFPSISTFLNHFQVGSEWKFTGCISYEFSFLSIQNWTDLLTLYFKIWFSLARDNGRDDNYLEEKMMNEENLMLGIKWKKYLKIVILKVETLGKKKHNSELGECHDSSGANMSLIWTAHKTLSRSKQANGVGEVTAQYSLSLQPRPLHSSRLRYILLG